jgi:hypothetical protein
METIVETKIIYENTIAKTCPRRRCFAPRLTRTHERRSDGSMATGLGGVQNHPELPIVGRTEFYECTHRIYHGCPARYR